MGFSHVIIDRRLNGKKKSIGNRQKFLRRVKANVKDAVRDAILNKDMKSLGKNNKVKVNPKDLDEPQFQHAGGSGSVDRVLPGNTDAVVGDTIKKPGRGAAPPGRQGSNDPNSTEDGFEFTLSKEEFMEIFFEDLELPDLIKKSLVKNHIVEYRRAGTTTSGPPNNLNVIRTFRASKSRRFALVGAIKKKIEAIESRLLELSSLDQTDEILEEVTNLRLQLEKLQSRLKKIPFIDDIDVRYNHKTKHTLPSTSAVMFCVMDVSGSMDDGMKELAKRFYILLYLFLQRFYETVDVVFIRHHTTAKEVDEQEFFYSPESGGTVVSSAFELMHEVITERYDPRQWNIYCCQATDGDNYQADNTYLRDLLVRNILPLTQYFAYLEIPVNLDDNEADSPYARMFANRRSDLWPMYEELSKAYPIQMKRATSAKEIYPVFRELFEKQ